MYPERHLLTVSVSNLLIVVVLLLEELFEIIVFDVLLLDSLLLSLPDGVSDGVFLATSCCFVLSFKYAAPCKALDPERSDIGTADDINCLELSIED